MAKTVDWAIQKAFLHAQRKATAPATGTSKYNALLGLADSFQKMWAAEDDTEWGSLYSIVTLAAVVSATDTYALTSTIESISSREGDYIRLTDGTNCVDVMVIEPDQLHEYRHKLAAAKVGRNLVFSKAFVAGGSYIGYSIQVPSNLYVADIAAGTDLIAVDDPMWLAYMMASDFVRNDAVKLGQYDNILQLAEQHMQAMKRNNGAQMSSVSTPWQAAGATW